MPRHTESTLAAIKQAVDIVALVGGYFTLHRAGTKYKALCPFHDDHNPSLELNPERQSFKCWSCGAGGDVFDFVKEYERVDFSEAVRMLAERAGIALDTPAAGRSAPSGPSKTDLLAVCAWAEERFARALDADPEARAYVDRRGIGPECVRRFRLGFAPDRRDWLQGPAARDGIAMSTLEAAGLVGRNPETGIARERFRGRLIFPIHDLRGRPIGFGGRIMPDVEERMKAAGKGIAKYLNSPETPLFQKRRNLYAADLARASARDLGWVAVVEGYTDVIAAHQAGLANVVGTLGTALGDDHVLALRRIADRVVLVFDGDEAGQAAADRSLELFLGHELDVRVLTLPEGLDPCDFLQREGAAPFRDMVERALDPLDFAIDRAAARFDIDSVEGARQAAEAVMSILAKVPSVSRAGLDLKVAKALDQLARRLRLPVDDLRRELTALRRPRRGPAEPPAAAAVSEARPAIRPADLDPLDRELIEVILNEPSAVGTLITRLPAAALRDAPLRIILQAAYDLHGEGQLPTFDRVTSRLQDPTLRALAAGLLLPIDRQPMPEGMRPAPPEARLPDMLVRLAERSRQERLRDVKAALDETDPTAEPEQHRALRLEYLKLLSQRPEPRKR